MSKDPKDVVIVGAARTPFGKLGGSLKPFQAPELGGMAIGRISTAVYFSSEMILPVSS